MSQEKNRVLAGELVSRASIEAARGGSIDDALSACDFDLAASIALAQAKAGAPAAAHTVSRILVGIEFPPVASALIATVPDKAALLAGLTARLYPRTKDAGEIEALALYAAWKAGVEAAAMIPELRRLVARQLTAEAYALLADDRSVDRRREREGRSPSLSRSSRRNMRRASRPTTRRSACRSIKCSRRFRRVSTSRMAGSPCAQHRRSDATMRPCGSGLKYKKCCADKPQAAGKPSPIAGVSWDDFLGAKADQMTVKHVDELALKDLVRVDLSRLGQKALVTALRRFASAHQWSHAQRVVNAAATRPPATPEEIAARRKDAEERVTNFFKGDKEETAAAIARVRSGDHVELGDELRDELIHALLDAGEYEHAREQITKLPIPLAKDYRLEMDIRDAQEGAWRTLVEQVREVVAKSDRVSSTELAYALLRQEPVLGILAARAAIGTWLVDDAETLLEVVEEARDKLNLPPTDPAWDVYDTIVAKEKKAETADHETRIREAVAESSTKIDQLERALASVRTELADAKTRPAAELIRQTSGGDQRDKLGDKLRELEARIREGNEERRQMRSELEAAAAASADDDDHDDRPRRGRHVEDADEDDDGDSLEPGSRNYAIPRFERRAIDALGEVPATVAAETMRTIGTLAAGDPYAWRGVKAAKDMPRQVLMGRVGIHHRLIFRSEGGNLDVIDLITREQLQTTLKRLRQGR